MRLKGKTAIITGVGAGIGEAIALRFAEEGAHLVLNDIQENAGEKTRDKVEKLGAKAALVVADISQESGARSIAAAAMQAFGAIDILVNNAADFTSKSVENAEPADWQKVLGVNIIGTAMVSKFAIEHMKARGGAIVNMASMSSIIAQRDFATYNASKGGILTMTKCMALDLAQHKIRVNSICPGCIFTSASVREIERMGLTFEQWRDKVAPMHMLGRLGEPREVANAALFLASDEASFITAAHLVVDGGYTAW
ncbi:MAG: glucose 1-dehydrogenase [Candidatus Solibacter usitatus]|nr:glucose 1-dehydrogenase [Candidatus Solibacter usitatus]